MMKRLAKGIGVNIFDKLVVSVTQLLAVPILAGHWGLERYGLWVMLSTVPTFLAIGDLGFATAAGTKMTIAEARGEREKAIRIFQSAWVAILLSSLVFTGLAVAISYCTPADIFNNNRSLSESDFRGTLFLLLMYGIAVVQGTIFFAGFRAAGQFATGALWGAVTLIIENGALICVVASGGGPVPAAAALLLGRMAGLAGQNILLRRRVPWLPVGFRHARRAEIKRLISPAGSVMLLPIAQACLLQGTALALGAAAGQAAVPAFTAARTLSRIGQQMCWTLNAALMPEVSSAIGRQNRDAVAMMVLCTMGMSALLIVPFALGFAVFGQLAVSIWSHHIITANALLIEFMALSIFFSGFWFPISNLIMAADRQGSYTTIYAVLALGAIPVSYGASIHLGAAGAAIAMAASDGLMLITIMRLTKRHLASTHAIISAAPRAWVCVKSKVQRFKDITT